MEAGFGNKQMPLVGTAFKEIRLEFQLGILTTKIQTLFGAWGFTECRGVGEPIAHSSVNARVT
jgi:hypothetical protein